MKKYPALFLVALCSMAITACGDDNDDPDPDPSGENISYIAFNLNNDFTYKTSTGAWTDCYDADAADDLVYANVHFSHTVTDYGAYGTFWGGFCPSNSSENADHSDDWTAWQWSNIVGTGWFVDQASGRASFRAGAPFMVANWNVSESLTEIPAEPSLKIYGQVSGSSTSLPVNIPFTPREVTVTNTTYGYYGMLDGTAYSKAFGDNDFCKVIFRGVRSGRVTDSVEVYLFKDGKILNAWTTVDLTSLGFVDYIYIQMESSDNSEYGMNNPAYFALGGLILQTE